MKTISMTTFDSLIAMDIVGNNLFCKRCGEEKEFEKEITEYDEKSGKPIKCIVMVRCSDYRYFLDSGNGNGHSYDDKRFKIRI